MTAQEFIQKQLDELAQPRPMQDIGNLPLEDAIFAKVMSKKFRKLKADADAITLTKSAIHRAVTQNKPITIGLLFGGNKLWRFDEAPEPDWADLLSLLYYLKWMKSIASIYEPGAHFDYCSMDCVVESLNNVPKKDTDRFQTVFKNMLTWAKPYFPEHVSVTYQRQAEMYASEKQYFEELEQAKKEYLTKHGLPVLSEARKIAVELNVILRPGQTDDPEWREKVELEHQAIFETESFLPYLTDPDIIPTCPTPYPELIATGSTKYSLAKFWAGVGALQKVGDSYHELVLTPKQLEAAKFHWEDVDLPGLTGKNFSKIRVLQ